MTVFHLQVFIAQLHTSGVDALVHGADVENVVKDVIAGDDDAVLIRCFVVPAGFAVVNIGTEEAAFVIWGAAGGADGFGDDVYQGGFAGAVAAVEEGDRLKGQCRHLSFGKHAEWIEGGIAGHLLILEKGALGLIIRYGEGFQVNHGSTLGSRPDRGQRICSWRKLTAECRSRRGRPS